MFYSQTFLKPFLCVLILFGAARLFAQAVGDPAALYWASGTEGDAGWANSSSLGGVQDSSGLAGWSGTPAAGISLPAWGAGSAGQANSYYEWQEEPFTGGFYAEPVRWTPQLLPQGTLYPAYLAGRKESRLQSMFTHDSDYGWLWDISLGGRVPLFRYGTEDAVQPEGFQIDMEGAALLRLDFERRRNLASTDYRAGVPITYGTKFWQFKTGYYHVSSHLGDSYLLDRFRKKVHYVRDEIFLGIAFKPTSALRLYGEAGWAFNAGETTSPWEFQMGVEFSPAYSAERACRGTPFAAVHGHLFQELDFGGYVNSQIGWQWRRSDNGLFRVGAEFYCGCDDQYQFHDTHQKKIGLGFWYDF